VVRLAIEHGKGCKVRFVIHNPYGVEKDKPYSFTQRRECARNDATSHVAHGLEDVLRKYTDAGHEPIVYVGKFETVGGITAETVNEWLWNVAEATRAGASIAFDDSIALTRDDPRSRFIELVRETLKPFASHIYVESRPAKWASQFHGDKWITEEKTGETQDPAKDKQAVAWAAPDEVLTGERIVYLQFPDDDATGKGWGGTIDNRAARMVKAIKRVQANGRTVAAWPGDLIRTYRN
jgi:hypothetical protein